MLNIEGPLDGLHVNRKIENWGKTFDIEFDIVLEKRIELSRGALSLIHLDHDHDHKIHHTHDFGVIIYKNKLAFEYKHEADKWTILATYDTELNKAYHIEFKQFKTTDDKTKRIVKINDEVQLDKEIENVYAFTGTLMVGDFDDKDDY